MDLMDLLGLAAIVALGGLWFEGLRARELALTEAKRACAGDGLQLLDDNVVLRRIGLNRDANGAMGLRRVYEFEFSRTGESRETGAVIVSGKHPVLINLPSAPPDEGASSG